MQKRRSVQRPKLTAKRIIYEYADELLLRIGDPERRAKLQAIESIAMRMNWNDLYKKLRFESGLHYSETKEEKWFQK